MILPTRAEIVCSTLPDLKRLHATATSKARDLEGRTADEREKWRQIAVYCELELAERASDRSAPGRKAEVDLSLAERLEEAQNSLYGTAGRRDLAAKAARVGREMRGGR